MSTGPIVTRELYLPREPVFDAWTQREHLVQWYAPPDCRVGQVVVEPVTGGRFELNWTDVSGAVVREWGTFDEITSPEGFVCTMGDRTSTAPEGATRLHLELIDLVDQCRLVLRQEGRSEHSAGDLRQSLEASFRQQWERRLDRLESYFSAI